MEAMRAVEKRRSRETAVERLSRQARVGAASVGRLALMSLILTPLILASVLTLDIPLRAFDWIFGAAVALRPSNWLTHGGFLMGIVPFFAILLSRKFGGDEASLAITASWGIAAIAVLIELSYLAPALSDSDLPGVRFTVAFVASAMAAQYVAANVYDVARGGGRWWRAPLYGALGGALINALVYFPGVYAGSGLPWPNWMIGDFAVKTFCAFIFLGFYAVLRKRLKPGGGYGGR